MQGARRGPASCWEPRLQSVLGRQLGWPCACWARERPGPVGVSPLSEWSQRLPGVRRGRGQAPIDLPEKGIVSCLCCSQCLGHLNQPWVLRNGSCVCPYMYPGSLLHLLLPRPDPSYPLAAVLKEASLA